MDLGEYSGHGGAHDAPFRGKGPRPKIRTGSRNKINHTVRKRWHRKAALTVADGGKQSGKSLVQEGKENQTAGDLQIDLGIWR